MIDTQSLHVRWLIRSDMPAVLAIEADRKAAGSIDPWDEERFLALLRKRNVIGLVVEDRDDAGHAVVKGFVIYELNKTNLYVLHLRGVWQHHQEALFDKLKGKLCVNRRDELRIDVHESDLPVQLWLKSLGFRCTAILRDRFGDGQDGYRMTWRKGTCNE